MSEKEALPCTHVCGWSSFEREREKAKKRKKKTAACFSYYRGGLWLAQAGTAGLKEEMAEDFFPVRSLTPVSQRHVSEKREVKSVGGFFRDLCKRKLSECWSG